VSEAEQQRANKPTQRAASSGQTTNKQTIDQEWLNKRGGHASPDTPFDLPVVTDRPGAGGKKKTEDGAQAQTDGGTQATEQDH